MTKLRLRKALSNYQEALSKGAEGEDRLFKICAEYKSAGKFPGDVIGVRPAGSDLDEAGVDALIDMTGRRTFPLNIKTSTRGVKKHQDRADRRHIPAVLVAPELRAQRVFENMLAIFERCRSGKVPPLNL